MEQKTKQILKVIIPQSFINYIRGIKRRINSGFSPVIKDVPSYIMLRCITDEKSDYVGGYYDVSPFSADGDKYLMLKLIGDNSADVILYSISQQTSRVINRTNAVNRQQGARLRWVYGSSEDYYFNDYIDDNYICVKANINSVEKKIVGPAFYDISDLQNLGVSLNFSRLGELRAGYGYRSKRYIKPHVEELYNEGIDIYKLDTQEVFRPVTYKKLIALSGWNPLYIDRFYINHICLSPSGTRFTFFWIDAMESDSNLKAMLVVYDIRYGTMKLLEAQLRVSHYAWKNDNEILVTVLDDRHQCSYVIYNVNTGEKKNILIEDLDVDGHPSWIDDRQFITDTYPDRQGYQTLYVVNSATGKKRVLVRMYHTCRCIGEKRCDMHPRVSIDKMQISFDGNIRGIRNVYLIQNKRV